MQMRYAPLLVEASDFALGAELGKGGCGTVYSATRRSDGVAVAWKELGQLEDPKDQQRFLREVMLPVRFNFDTVVRVLGFKLPDVKAGRDCHDTCAVIVMEIMPRGDLRHHVEHYLEHGPTREFGPTELSKAAFGIAITMMQVHERNAIHRDLKPENVFLDDNMEIKIADFGLSKIIRDGLKNTMSIGSPLFMAPELLMDQGHGYDNTVDVFSFAVTLYRMFTRKLVLSSGKPPGRLQQVMMQILQGQRLGRDRIIPDHWWGLIEKCWSQGPVDRPSFADIVDRFVRDKSFVFPGTDMDAYNEYQTRMIEMARQKRNEVVVAAAPPNGTRRGLRSSVLAATGNAHIAEIVEQSQNSAILTGKTTQAYKRFPFKQFAE